MQEEKYFRHMATYSAYGENDKEKAVNYVMRIINGKQLKHFYRYRPSCDYEIDTLDKRQIYLCKPKVYEDKEDCQIKINEKELIIHYLKHSKKIFKITYELISRTKMEMKDNPKWIKLMDAMRNDCLVACCTETYDNEYMWTNYADNSTGICIEYDMLELLDFVKQNNWSYMPIRYIKDRHNQKDIYFTSREFNMDKDTVEEAILKYKLSCMTKNVNPYFIEREWRILGETPKSLKESDDNGKVYNFIKPKKIIMGKNIKENESFYKKVCEYKEKNKDVEVVEYGE